MSHTPTVTISVQEYDSLREIKKALENKDVYLRIQYYSDTYVTNNKDEWMSDMIKHVGDLRQDVQDKRYKINDLESLIRRYEEKYGKLK